MHHHNKRGAIFQAFLVTFLWSTSWVLIKIFITTIPPLTFAGFRYALAVLILLPGFRPHKDSLRTLSKKDWVLLYALGLVFYTVTQGGQFLALKYLKAANLGIIMNFSTIAVALLGLIGLGEKPTKWQWAGLFIFISGVLIYFQTNLILESRFLGYIFAIITVFANAISSVLGRTINKKRTIPPRVITIISMGIGSIFLLVAASLIEGPVSFNLRHIGVIAWLALVNTAFAFTLWNKTLQTLTTIESSMINNTMLIQIAVLAWIFLGESLSLFEIAGLILASCGIVIVQIKQKTVEDPMERNKVK